MERHIDQRRPRRTYSLDEVLDHFGFTRGEIETPEMPYTAEDIELEPTKGKKTDRLYRRVRLAEDFGKPGLVRYEPELEQVVTGSIRAYIAADLNLMERKSSEKVLQGKLIWWEHPVEIPLPKR